MVRQGACDPTPALGAAALPAHCRGLWYVPASGSYGVDVPSMLLIRRGCGIHALCLGGGQGSAVTGVRPERRGIRVESRAGRRVALGRDER